MSRRTQWVALKVVRRVGKAIPVIGTLVAIGFFAHSVRRKGVVGGVVDTTLDAIPFVGLVKNGIEFFTDDLIPDRPVALPATPDRLLNAQGGPGGRGAGSVSGPAVPPAGSVGTRSVTPEAGDEDGAASGDMSS